VKKRSVREGLKEQARVHLFMEGARKLGASFMVLLCVCLMRAQPWIGVQPCRHVLERSYLRSDWWRVEGAHQGQMV
jgi:hypothetical protein